MKNKKITFFDNTNLLKTDSNRVYTDEGYLVVPARIGRTGIQPYLASELGLKGRNPTEVINVYRPESEVFNDTSLASFANKPVTNEHPADYVNAKNYKDLAIGFSHSNVERDGDYAKTTLQISDAKTIEDIELGKVQISNGYLADMVPEKGTYDGTGENYEFVQRNIRGNHIAIVAKGRAGPSCKLSDDNQNIEDKKVMPKKIMINDISYEVDDQVEQAVAKLQKDNASSLLETKEAKKALQDSLDTVTAERDQLKTDLEEAKKLILSDAEIEARAATRQALIADAKSISPELDTTGLSTVGIKAAALKDVGIDVAGKSDGYIDARFDARLESVDKTVNNTVSDAISEQMQNQATKTNDVDTRPADVIARENAIKRLQDSWKSKK